MTRLHGAVVYSAGEIIKQSSRLAEHFLQVAQGASPQLRPREDAHVVHLLGRLGSHAPKILYAQLVYERLRLVGMDGAESVRLTAVRRYLGQELVVGYARRGGQPRFLLDAAFDFLGYVHGQLHAHLVARHVQEGLVDGERLYQVGVVLEYPVYLVGNLLVSPMPARDDYQRGTAFLRYQHGHGGAHAPLPGLIAGRGHYAPFAVSAHGDGFPS